MTVPKIFFHHQTFSRFKKFQTIAKYTFLESFTTKGYEKNNFGP